MNIVIKHIFKLVLKPSSKPFFHCILITFSMYINPHVILLCIQYWDDELAKVAQHFASACDLSRAHDANRAVPG